MLNLEYSISDWSMDTMTPQYAPNSTSGLCAVQEA
jgi:hypothetical protein